MENQYGMGDLRQYIDGRPLFPAISQPPDLLHRAHPYDMLIFRSDHSTLNSDATVAFNAEAAGDGGDGGAGRWPRQETLSLLEIRSKLDPKFKEANQKGPLWDEVSRIMSQEHGYQRSGKKCREKFENLYKYYKKTKEGKAGRQDGKHYRFFRQLEALYGDTAHVSNLNSGAATSNFHYSSSSFPNCSNDHHQEAYHPASKISGTSHVSIPDSCDYDATSSYCSDSNVGGKNIINGDDLRMRKRKGKSLKAKIEASIDAQMKSMMEKQEAWMERMTTIIEGKERERLLREEQWRRQDAARIDGEQKMWAAERAWLEARDAALMETFNKLAGKEHPPQAPAEGGGVVWMESEVKKRKENANKGLITYSYDQNGGVISDDGVAGVEGAMRRLHGGGGSGDHVSDGLIRYLMGDSYNQRL